MLAAHVLFLWQGFTTYYLYGDSEIRHVSYFWKILERCFPPEVKSSVKGLRMNKDSKGVVFDLPSDLSDVVKVCSSDIFKQCVCVLGGCGCGCAIS